ncbi:MAG: YebC/PmpR family DNA-binding transcriptional regulator [Acidobacteria bacterium]|jgi:YebC/PmpR family DNA-binding regulatory protein|nr:YebC/PmpR family DNA-binding transcriptional regulator [Acidobacteriota bacterium]
MSGHNKWANIKARKGSQDAKRGKMFTKTAKEIIIAAKIGGGDPDGNARLRAAIQAARAINMPNDNIKRAIARGTGAEGDMAYEEVMFEGFGPAGVAILVEAQTENRNRTTGEIRHLFSKYGGNMGVPGCAARNFQRQGQITIPAEGLSEEKVFEAAIEAGAEDVQNEGDAYTIITSFSSLNSVNDALVKAGLPVASAKPVYVPTVTVKLAGDHAKGLLKLMDALEDNDDVANVWANFDIDDADIEAFES